ncbi:unnamed protein product [Symbiodinium natans]|uniref:Uncharacterized protein n=1 Tax=Symbiodinium natans TaxID=878477 RepID=A0A812UHQ8_9DINO|nr:unnamed protein product [Symbiodinium natans]
MPQYCAGFQDPSGGSAAPCIFAKDGKGGRAYIKRKRDGNCCAFCCVQALEHALNSRFGTRHIVRRLIGWQKQGSPTYKAAFVMSSLVVLPEARQIRLRYKAGERSRFLQTTSWLHKRKVRLRRLLSGRPPPQITKLSEESEQFLRACKYYGRADHPSTDCAWVKLLHKDVAAVSHHRQQLRRLGNRSRHHRRAWWKLRRTIRKCLLPYAQGPPYLIPVAWAMEEAILSDA